MMFYCGVDSVGRYVGRGQSRQAIKLFQITSVTSIISKHSTIPVPDSHRHLERKLVLPSVLTHDLIT